MKKILILISLVISLLMVLAACSSSSSSGVVHEFKDGDYLPASIAVNDDEQISFLLQNYSKKYSLVGYYDDEDVEEIKDEGDFDAIWIRSSEDIFAWSVESDNEIKIEYATQDDKEPITAATIEYDDETNYQTPKMAVYGDTIYYIYYDYGKKESYIYAYDTSKEKRITFDKTSQSAEETAGIESFSSIDISGENLSYNISNGNGGQAIKVTNLDSKDEKTINLPSNVGHIYATSYVSEEFPITLYYYDQTDGTENVGTYIDGDSEVKSIYTLASTDIIHNDHIALKNNNLYFVTQSNVSGNIYDHYTLTKYNINDDTYESLEGCFEFDIANDTLYTLSFDHETQGTDIVLLEKEEIDSEDSYNNTFSFVPSKRGADIALLPMHFMYLEQRVG